MRRIGIVLLMALIITSSLIPVNVVLADSSINGEFESENYRNLFTETGRTSEEVQAKLDAAWNHLFYGNDIQKVYYPVGTDMAYIKDIGHNDVRSEGMSYGMMICVQMNKKAEFDRLWKWAKTNMYHADGQFKGFFAWQCNESGVKMDNTPASDGDEYFAMALLFASNRWGDSTGIFNYRKEALSILDAMLHQSDDGVGVNMFDKDQKKVVFCPVGDAAKFTDPSYHLPAFYELWSLWADKDNALWGEIAQASREFFKSTTNSVTGLGPDYANFDGTPKEAPWGGGHKDFRFDAWRIASNIAVDYAWWEKDQWQSTFADRIQGFFYNEGIGSYGNQYTLSGTKLSNDHSSGLVAMNAVTALASTTGISKSFIDELWYTSIPSGQWRYYDGMLYMLAMLHCSGNFKIWKPETMPEQNSTISP